MIDPSYPFQFEFGEQHQTEIRRDLEHAYLMEGLLYRAALARVGKCLNRAAVCSALERLLGYAGLNRTQTAD
jgi:hypothetical protein